MKTYCPDCGAASDHMGKKPNFCYSCGYSFSMSSLKNKEQGQEEENSPEEMKNIPDILGLDVEIDSADDYKKYKYGEVIGTLGSNNSTKSKDDFIHPKQTNEQILQSIKKESETLREKK